MQFQRPFRPWPIPTAEGNGRLQSIMQMKADDIQMTNDDHFHPLEFQVTAPRLSVCALIHRGSVTTRTRTTCPSSAPRRHRRRRRHLWLTLATILLASRPNRKPAGASPWQRCTRSSYPTTCTSASTHRRYPPNPCSIRTCTATTTASTRRRRRRKRRQPRALLPVLAKTRRPPSGDLIKQTKQQQKKINQIKRKK